jgi:hypothetical protein
VVECRGGCDAVAALAATIWLKFVMLYVCGVPQKTEALVQATLPHLNEELLVS